MKIWHQFLRVGLGEIMKKRCLTRAPELSEIMAEEWRVKLKLAQKITSGKPTPPRLLRNRHEQEKCTSYRWSVRVQSGYRTRWGLTFHQVWSALTVHVSLCVQDPGHQARTFHPPVLTWTFCLPEAAVLWRDRLLSCSQLQVKQINPVQGNAILKRENSGGRRLMS